MAGLSNAKKKEVAEDLYIRAGLTARQISEQINISEQTLVKWKREGDWEKRKNEISISPLHIKEMLLKEAMKIANGEKSLIEADKLSKITSAIEKIDKRLSPRVVFDVLREFDNWMAENDPHLAVEFTKMHKLFLQHRINIEGNGYY